MKNSICIENRKYETEDILRIVLANTENGLWSGLSTIQESGFVVNTTCWNCGGKSNNAPDCPSSKTGGNAIINQDQKHRGKWSATRNGEPTSKDIDGKPFNYNPSYKLWDRQLPEGGSETKTESPGSSKPTAHVASFTTVVQNERRFQQIILLTTRPQLLLNL